MERVQRVNLSDAASRVRSIQEDDAHKGAQFNAILQNALKDKNEKILNKAAKSDVVQNVREEFAKSHKEPFHSLYYLFRYNGKLILLAQFDPPGATDYENRFFSVEEKDNLVSAIANNDFKKTYPELFGEADEYNPDEFDWAGQMNLLTSCDQKYGSKKLSCTSDVGPGEFTSN